MSMEAREFWDRHGTEIVKQVCDRAGTKFSFWKRIANHHRRPSPEMAEKLSMASLEIVGKPLSVVGLLEITQPKRGLKETLHPPKKKRLVRKSPA